MNTYDQGDSVTLSATFAVGGVNTDPGEVTLKVKNPAGTTTTYLYSLAQVTRSAVGIYTKEIDLATEGYWHYRWEGTTTAKGATEGVLFVRTSEF